MKYIDNLRLLVIVLVVMQHLAVTFSGFGGWYYKEGAELTVVEMSAFGFYESFMQAFFMGLLFLIAGYFVPGAYDRKGFGRFLGIRLIRLVVPAAVYMVVIHPLILYFQLDLYWIRPKPGLFAYFADYVTGGAVLEGSGPMWFVLALFVFTLVYGLARLVRGRPGKALKLEPKTSNMILLMLAVAAAAFAIRTVQPIGTSVLNMQLCYFAQYIALFIVGVLAYRSGLFSKLDARKGKRWLLAALVPGYAVWSAIMLLGGALEGNESYSGGLTWQSAAFALWESFTAVAVSAGLITLFREKYNYQGRIIKAMSQSAFAVYMFHTPVIIAAAQLAKPLPLPPLAKFVLLSLICVPLCFALAHFVIRRIPLLKRVL
jgi:fucose 4-O-acetylase-like acetyltransferase